jgi:hypothetical protein
MSISQRIRRIGPWPRGRFAIEWALGALGNPDVTHFTMVTDVAANVMHIYPYADGDAAQWTAVDLNKEFR